MITSQELSHAMRETIKKLPTGTPISLSSSESPDGPSFMIGMEICDFAELVAKRINFDRAVKVGPTKPISDAG